MSDRLAFPAARQRLQRAVRGLAALPWAELAAAGLLLAGWALVTWGIATLTVWQAWPISAGLLCLCLFGWRFFGTIARDGLYTLTRERGR